ncbi:MAG: DUF2336 domain-containing protein [Caulobacteraceae bacterium]|nr:DUF2336 domain-containing protein [Caulobacteraceae bacterium]
MPNPVRESGDRSDPAAPPPSRARRALLKRLADVVSLPASRVNAFERAMTADLLVEMLREAHPDERARVAARVAPLSEIPNSLVRLMLRDEVAIARLLIDDCTSLTDADLVSCAMETGLEHREVIAERKGLSEVVAEIVAGDHEPSVLMALLNNMTARLSQPTIEIMVAVTQGAPELIPQLLRRPELRPSGAYIMFWWSDAEARRAILQRFAVSREVLQEAVDDIFSQAAGENWSDPLTRKALQFIERRQRNRAAVEKSPYDSLEDAIDAAGREGLDRLLVQEIAYLSGLKPPTCAKVLGDRGGEPIAVLCKATGLPKTAVQTLWTALKRPLQTPDGQVDPDLERVLVTYDMLAVDRAQTVLRYWNWALSSALTPSLIKAIRDGDAGALDEYSVPQRAAMLALGDDFRS